MPLLQTLKDRQNATVAAVSRTFDEPVLLAFLSKGLTDPQRGAVEIRAPLRVGGGEEGELGGGAAKGWRTRLAAGRAELHIDRATYHGPPVRVSDRVRAIERPGQPWFEVLRVDDRGDTRLVLVLGEV